MSALSERDALQMAALGIARGEVDRQLALFARPPAPIRLARPCRVGDGITVLDPEREPWLLARAEGARRAGRCWAFIPASGAASRMFEAPLGCLRAGLDGESLKRAAASGEAAAAATLALLSELEHSPFREPLAALLAARGEEAGRLRSAGRHRELLEALLLPDGLDYARLPKALLPFHRTAEGARTAFEEHLWESAATVTGPGGTARVHFTIAADQEPAFRAALERARPAVEAALGVALEVTFSSQDCATDTFAVDLDNQPFRLADGSLLFRPGGHGALLGNLQALADAGADLLLVKNIDNVLPEGGRALVVGWRLLLLGHLLELAAELAHWRRSAGEGDQGRAGAAAFLADRFGHRVAAAEDAAALQARLRRPLRVCGMVRNQGEPGGGPFWVAGADGEISRQIVEASQVSADPSQRAILSAATHFNPVDMVCSLRDPEGRPYDLAAFADPATVLIAQKSAEGRPLKALERPGLWNGAMAGWHTAFVEVPAATFAPVKTALDLLRPEHRGAG